MYQSRFKEKNLYAHEGRVKDISGDLFNASFLQRKSHPNKGYFYIQESGYQVVNMKSIRLKKSILLVIVEWTTYAICVIKRS